MPAFDRLVTASNWLGSVWVCVLMLLIVADVLMRSLLNAPIVGVTEIMEMSIVAMLYMQTTQALRDGRHTRSEAFFGRLQARSPRAARTLNLVFYAAGFALMLAILYAGIPKTLEAYHGNFTIGNPGVFSVPGWPIRAIVVYGCVLMAIQFARMCVQTWRDLRTGAPLASAAGAPDGQF